MTSLTQEFKKTCVQQAIEKTAVELAGHNTAKRAQKLEQVFAKLVQIQAQMETSDRA